MEKNKKYKLELSSPIEIENLLDRVDLGSIKLSTHVRILVTKLKHQIKLEITNLYLANALYISRLGTVRNSGFSRSVIIREKNMSKKLIVQRAGGSDYFQTPESALAFLIPFLNKNWRVWECASGKNFDFTKNNLKDGYDIIVTNPPYSMKEDFLKRCYALRKPFALLMPLTALESERRQKYYRKHGLQLFIPNKRIDFKTPAGEGSSSWFATAWFTKGLNLPTDLTFIKIENFALENTTRSFRELT